MKSLPEDLTESGQTPRFTAETVPEPLTNWHQTGGETWAKIIVHQGVVTYEIMGSSPETVQLSTAKHGVIEPEVPHRVSLSADAEMQVIFYKSSN